MFDGLVVMSGGHCTHPTGGPAIRLKRKKTFPVIPNAQNYRDCMETKKAIFSNSKERKSSLVLLLCEHELICLLYEGENL